MKSDKYKLIIVRQRGVSLLIVLILLLIMTLLGLASMRVGLLQERMGGGQFDRSLSFQAVEAALREAEARIQATPVSSFPAAQTSPCVAGLCPTPLVSSANRWELASPPVGVWATAAADVTQNGLTAAPQYIIEYMGKTPKNLATVGSSSSEDTEEIDVFRITARSTQVDRATVILQSNYTKP